MAQDPVGRVVQKPEEKQPVAEAPVNTHDTDEALAAIKSEAGNVGVQPVRIETADTAQYAEEQQRRTPVKTMRPAIDQNPAARVVQTTEDRETAIYMFLSKFPGLIIYVERTVNGVLMNQQITFKNGMFQTNDPEIAAAIRAHKRCNSDTFREAPSQEAAVLYQRAVRSREAMRNGISTGVTSAMQGNDSAFMQHDAQLGNLTDRIMKI